MPEVEFDVLPPHSGRAERALARAVAEQAFLPVEITRIWSPDRVPEAFLPFLAWALSVDHWDGLWSVERKREVVAASVEVHRHKGTPYAIKLALRAAGLGDATLIERGEAQTYDGSAMHDGAITCDQDGHWADYRVIMAQPIANRQAALLRRLLNSVAPARCRLVSLDFRAVAHSYDGATRYDGAYDHGEA